MLVYPKIAGEDMAAHAGVGDFHGSKSTLSVVAGQSGPAMPVSLKVAKSKPFWRHYFSSRFFNPPVPATPVQGPEHAINRISSQQI